MGSGYGLLRVFIQQVASVLSLKSAYKKSDAGSHLIFSLATGYAMFRQKQDNCMKIVLKPH
jgi:hypothetical protein